MKGSEFVRKLQKLGRRRNIAVAWVPERGKGSHGLLYFGAKMTTVRNLKDELDKGAFHGMLKQLGLTARDVE
ncbi:MAG: type II toxin-antitoxin system HicA family toxin [Acidobacteria bacterium]|nr:type II toxin-antitoxin system HicA family toxin [Acidobacteriota bacterium]